MSKGLVYLAGPILGRTHDAANDWRILVAAAMEDHNILGISPLRCEPLIGDLYQNHHEGVFGDPKGIFTKNLFDTKRCDLVLAYLPKPEWGQRQSWGTLMEVAWGRAFDKPVIVVTDDPDVAQHAVLQQAASWIVPSLDEGVEVCVGLLAGYHGGKNV